MTTPPSTTGPYYENKDTFARSPGQRLGSPFTLSYARTRAAPRAPVQDAGLLGRMDERTREKSFHRGPGTEGGDLRQHDG